MSLIKCPSCAKQISNKIEACPHCFFSLVQNEDEIQRLKKQKFRVYRDKMYRLKMFSYSAIALAVFGVVPMIWSYIEALSYGFNAQITNHWGVNFVLIGFFMYVLSRLLMIFTKRNYKREL